MSIVEASLEYLYRFQNKSTYIRKVVGSHAFFCGFYKTKNNLLYRLKGFILPKIWQSSYTTQNAEKKNSRKLYQWIWQSIAYNITWHLFWTINLLTLRAPCKKTGKKVFSSVHFLQALTFVWTCLMLVQKKHNVLNLQPNKKSLLTMF